MKPGEKLIRKLFALRGILEHELVNLETEIENLDGETDGLTGKDARHHYKEYLKGLIDRIKNPEL